MKLYKYVFIISSFIVFSCSSNENPVNDNIPVVNNNLNETEYVKLLPEVLPNTLKSLSDGKYLLSHSIGSSTLTLGMYDDNGVLIWDKLFSNGTIGTLNDIYINNQDVYFASVDNDGIKFTTLDLSGNITGEIILENSSFFGNRIFKFSGSSFYIGYIDNGVFYMRKYSLAGQLIDSFNLPIDSTSSIRSVEVKNDYIFVIELKDFNNSVVGSYENLSCSIFSSEGTFVNEIITPYSNFSTSGIRVLNTGSILISKSNSLISEFEKYEVNGDLLNSHTITGYYSGNIFEDENQNLVFFGSLSNGVLVNNRSTEMLKMDSNFNVLYNRYLGGSVYDVVGLFGENNTSYILVGTTESTNGDFDLPNNSDGLDTFIFKLDK